MTAVAVTLFSTRPNKQAREKKIILKESRYAKRERGERERVVIYSRFKINSNISRAFFKIYLSFRKYFLRPSPIQTTNKYLEKGRKKIILEGNEAKTHRTGRRLSGVMGNAADNRRYRSP